MFPIEENIYMPQNEEQQKVLYKKILESFSAVRTPVLFKNIIEEWMENSKPLLKASTYIKYRNMICSYILPYLEDYTTEELTVDCLNTFCRELLCSGGVKSRDFPPKPCRMYCHFYAVSSAMRIPKESYFHAPGKKS